MNPSKPTTGITFNTTESMAERAWRYGEAELPHRDLGNGFLLFDDGSAMGDEDVDTAISWRQAAGIFIDVLFYIAEAMDEANSSGRTLS